MRTMVTAAGFLILLASHPGMITGGSALQSPAALVTRWAARVSPDSVLPEYPRPDLVQRDWRNLNGRSVGDYFFAPVVGATLHAGRNVIAVHAHKTRNSGSVDAGLVDVVEAKR